MLLLHGWLATADLNWFAVYEPLGAIARVVAMDHRGHGRGLRGAGPFSFEAAADDAAAVLDLVGTGPVIACGYSMGGPIALHLAHRRPDLVSGLVLCATALRFRDHRRDWWQWWLLSLAAVAIRFGADTWGVIRLIDEVAATEPVVARWRDRLVAEAKRLNTTDAVAAGRALGAYDARDLAPQLGGLPAVVVRTNRDRLVVPRRQSALAEALGAPVIDLDGDHDAFLRQPGAWAHAVVGAVSTVTTVTTVGAPEARAASAAAPGGAVDTTGRRWFRSTAPPSTKGDAGWPRRWLARLWRRLRGGRRTDRGKGDR